MQQNLAHLINWALDATDGGIGTVEDFYFDDQTWAVKYLVVKTGGWLSGRKVLISPTVVIGKSWDLGLFPVSITKEQVRNSPDINTDKPVSRQHEAEGATSAREDFHLRSAQQVGGYHIHANDGDIGHVVDFIFDDQNWQISHLLIDTHNWVGGEKIILAVHHIREIQWQNSKVVVDLSIDGIKNSFSLNKWTHIIDKAVNAEREKPISQHY
jgi:uncharacterized protein YrrD